MERIGVLALQGDFAEHICVLEKLGVEAREVRVTGEIDGLDGLIVPGGESTTMVRLIDLFSLRQRLVQFARSGAALWGTCAGMILLGNTIIAEGLQPLRLIDVDVKRNAYGRQVDSFEANLDMPVLGGPPFRGVFIRAPIIEKVGRGVEVLARLPNGNPVAARQHNLLVSSFHPELTSDVRFHGYFVKLARARSEETNVATT